MMEFTYSHLMVTHLGVNVHGAFSPAPPMTLLELVYSLLNPMRVQD